MKTSKRDVVVKHPVHTCCVYSVYTYDCVRRHTRLFGPPCRVICYNKTERVRFERDKSTTFVMQTYNTICAQCPHSTPLEPRCLVLLRNFRIPCNVLLYFVLFVLLKNTSFMLHRIWTRACLHTHRSVHREGRACISRLFFNVQFFFFFCQFSNPKCFFSVTHGNLCC